jgi:hypothetical protein
MYVHHITPFTNFSAFKTSTMPYLPAVFRKMRDRKLPSNSLSDHATEQVDVSARQCTLQVTPGGTPSWASQPWHYVFRVSAYQSLGAGNLYRQLAWG